MQYRSIVTGTFVDRPNRFIAHVTVNGQTETVHVKNTGRCRELLLPGVQVVLDESDNPARKTKYDLIAVYKGSLLINMDSQVPNRVAGEWLAAQGCADLRPETTYGGSRFDFSFTRNGRPCYLEVKGCTLEVDGQGYFPDAPTQRGARHLGELARAAEAGYGSYLAFVIQMAGVHTVLPNTATDPAFAAALADARRRGVRVVYLGCAVTPDTLTVDRWQWADGLGWE